MKISKQGLDFIKSFEGCRLEAYWDKHVVMLRENV